MASHPGVCRQTHHHFLEAQRKGGLSASRSCLEVTSVQQQFPSSRWEPEIQAGWAQQLQQQQPQLDVALCPSCALHFLWPASVTKITSSPILQMRRLRFPDVMTVEQEGQGRSPVSLSCPVRDAVSCFSFQGALCFFFLKYLFIDVAAWGFSHKIFIVSCGIFLAARRLSSCGTQAPEVQSWLSRSLTWDLSS